MVGAMRGLIHIGGTIVAGLLFCGIAAPALCLPPAPRHIVLSKKSELKISWRAMINRAPARFRLYRIDRSGSTLLIEQTAEGLGVGSFGYIDRGEFDGESIRFRLCMVGSDGTEIILGIIDCVQSDFAEGQSACFSTGTVMAALLPAEMAEIPPGRWGLKAYGGRFAKNLLSRPPVPPPRRSN
jgi:hypothetical protein